MTLGSISFSITYRNPKSEIRHMHVIHYKSKFYHRSFDNKLQEAFDTVSEYIISMLKNHDRTYGNLINPITKRMVLNLFLFKSIHFIKK